MAKLEWDRLLETCCRRNAYDILLMPGFSPFIRLQDELRALQVPPLEPQDLRALVADIIPPTSAVTDEYAYHDFSYGDVWFRATAFGFPETAMLLVMRHSLDWRPPES